jgi:hypothetical protein
MRVFIDIPSEHDVKALLQDRVLVLCCVGSWHNDVVVVFVAMDVCRYRVLGVLKVSLDDVEAFFVKKILPWLMLCTRRTLSVDVPMTFRKRRCFVCISFSLSLMLMLARLRCRCISKA